jgi:hypothetical protein
VRIAAAGLRSVLVAAALATVIACVGDSPESQAPPTPTPGTDSGPGPAEAGQALDAGDHSDAKPKTECDPDGKFVELAPLDGDVNAATAERPTLTEDELDIFFNSGSRADASLKNEIFTAHRATINEPFGPATRVQAVSSGSQEAHPAISGDGLLLFYSGQASGSGHLTLAFTTRAERSLEFEKPTVGVPSITGSNNDTRPFLTLDKSALYFASDRPGTLGAADIYVAKSTGAGFQTASPLAPPINSPANESNAVLTADGRTLYFARDNKVMRAHRTSSDGVFEEPKLVEELNTSGAMNEPGWISRDQCRFYFQTDRAAQTLWLATRHPSP